MEGIFASILGMLVVMAIISIPITLREMNKKLDIIITHLEKNQDN